MLSDFFKLKEHNTTVKTEVLAGVTTFLAMSYIIFVNPNILGGAGMNPSAVFVATCLAAATGSFIMAFLANWPVAMAPGMGLNAFFAFTVVLGMGFTWQQALGAVFLSGVIFIILTATGVRNWLIKGIPPSLRAAIAAGIGIFIAFIGLQTSGIIVDNPATLVGLTKFDHHGPILAILGLFIIIVLDILKVRGSILIGILSITIISIIGGYTTMPDHFFSLPPSLSPTFLQLDILGALNHGIFYVVLAMILVEIFDATGTLVSIAKRASLIKENDEKGLGKALFADSIAILVGSLLGTSSTTAYVESTSGVEAGGRTGLTAFVVGVLFLVVLFASPIAGLVPAYASAPALIYVGCLMIREMLDITWEDASESIPAAITIFMMPFSYSIAEGLAAGFISYTVIKLLTGKVKDIHPASVVIALLFATRYSIEAYDSLQAAATTAAALFF